MTWRTTLKTVLGTGLWPVSQAILHGIQGEQGLILMFHYIRPPILDGVSSSLFVSRESFGEMLDLVVQSFNVLEPVEFFERMQAGQLPPRATLLTFDDGGVDNVTNALPELQKRDLKAAFFVCPGLIDSGAVPPTMQLARMLAQAKAGLYELSFSPQFSNDLNLPTEIEFNDHVGECRPFTRSIRRYGKCTVWIIRSSLSIWLSYSMLTDEDDVTDFRLASWDELAAIGRCRHVCRQPHDVTLNHRCGWS